MSEYVNARIMYLEKYPESEDDCDRAVFSAHDRKVRRGREEERKRLAAHQREENKKQREAKAAEAKAKRLGEQQKKDDAKKSREEKKAEKEQQRQAKQQQKQLKQPGQKAAGHPLIVQPAGT